MQRSYATLTAKQTKALGYLALGHSAAEVSKKASVSEQQICKWKKDESFLAALEELRRDMFNESTQVFASLSLKAIETIRDLMLKSDHDQTRLKAAIFVLEKAAIPNLAIEGIAIEPDNDGINFELLIAALKGGVKGG